MGRLCRRKEVLQQCLVNGHWVQGFEHGGASCPFAWGAYSLGSPSILAGGFAEEIGPVGRLRSYDGFEVAYS